MRIMNTPKRFPNIGSLLFALTLLSPYLHFAEGHGYMDTPRSRNVYARQEGTSGGAAGVPPTEYCEHCLNRKVENGSCGIGQSGDYDEWLDSEGNPMPWISQENYVEGQTIIVSGVLTTNHAGHIEVYACPDHANPSPSCFTDNPLTMITDIDYGGPNDNTYPVRGYLSTASQFKFSYQLPTGLTGDKVLIQWRYITANSCHPPGYSNPDLGLEARGWLRGPNLPACPDLSPIGVGVPEQFWNCAEVTIHSGSPTSPSPPTSSTPTSAPPTPAPETPTSETTTPPVAPTTDPLCGVDNDECTDGNACCGDYECIGTIFYKECQRKQDATCVGRWDDCTNTIRGCCSGLECVGDQYYKQCQKPERSEPSPSPTLQVLTPTKNPTKSPTKSPSDPPVDNSSGSDDHPNEGSCGVDTDRCGGVASSSLCCGDYECVGDEYYKSCQPKEDTICLLRWTDCTNDIDACCNGLECLGNQYYRMCTKKR